MKEGPLGSFLLFHLASNNVEEPMKPHQIKFVKESIDAAVGNCRFDVLQTVEQILGDGPDWPAVRSRLLRIFGTKAGLEARVSQIFAQYFAEGRDDV